MSAENVSNGPTTPVPPPDAPPPTMPAAARTGEPPPLPRHASAGGPDGEPSAAGVPPGTGPDMPAAEGTSEAAAAVTGVHTPDVGEGGEDLDIATPPLAGRPAGARE